MYIIMILVLNFIYSNYKKFMKYSLYNKNSSSSLLTTSESPEKLMSIYEHLEELRQRTIYALLWFIICFSLSFTYIKQITNILQAPAVGIKFLQLAPGEYLFASIKISIFSALLLSIPVALYQILSFINPGLTSQEKSILIPITIGSSCLFFIGILFGYFLLEPAALKFLISYGSDIIEPLWSFKEYFDFTIMFLFSTALVFQVPVIQVVLGSLNIISSTQMLRVWKYVILFSTIISAIITPSTDPFTQILLSIAILCLYFGGVGFLYSFNK